MKDFGDKLKSASMIIDMDFMDNVIRESLYPNEGDNIGDVNLVIIMEELGELIEANHMYAETQSSTDYIHLLEEIADNILCLRYAQIIAGITSEDIDKASDSLSMNNLVNMSCINKSLSVMIQIISKFYRLRHNMCEDSYTEILSELIRSIAEVRRNLYIFADLLKFSKCDINKAINVKLNRQCDRNNKIKERKGDE